MRLEVGIRIAIAVILVCAGCSSGGNGTSNTSRVRNCAKRFLERALTDGSPNQVRRYVETAYCKPFDERGWVNENGTLSLDAYRHVQSGGTCATAGSGEPMRTVPCEEIASGGPLILDCAILHLVPRAEVAPYVAKLKRQREVQCDDETPLSELGVGASSTSRLTIAGAVHATTREASVHEESCGYRPNRTLIYGGGPLRLGRGPAVARIEFFIRLYRGLGRYDATGPAPYGRTAVQVVTGRNAATGVASGFYIATSGTVTVSQARDVGRTGHRASLSGTVHAALEDGSKRVRVDGTWHCSVDATSNEGP